LAEFREDEQSQLLEESLSDMISVRSVSVMSVPCNSAPSLPGRFQPQQAESPRSAQSFPSMRALQKCGRTGELSRPVSSSGRRPTQHATHQLPPLPGTVADWVPQIARDHLREAQAGRRSRPVQEEEDLKVTSFNSLDHDLLARQVPQVATQCVASGAPSAHKPPRLPEAPKTRAQAEASPHAMQVICWGCGTQNDADARFCKKCGRKTEERGPEHCSSSSRSRGRRLKRMLSRLWKSRSVTAF